MTFDVQASAGELDAALRALGTLERAAGEKRYLKSALVFYGVTVPQVRKLAKGFAAEHPELPKAALLSLVHALWQPPKPARRRRKSNPEPSAVHERRSLAIALLAARAEDLRAKDLGFVEALLRGCEGWAHVDWLSAHVAGSLVRRFATCKKALDRWARDESFWLRRSALLSLLVELRAGAGDFEHFARLAVPMLGEREFFIRKAIGWVLRDTGRKRPELVEAFVEAHLGQLSRLSLREAIKHFPEAKKAALLAGGEGERWES